MKKKTKGKKSRKAPWGYRRDGKPKKKPGRKPKRKPSRRGKK